MKTPEDLSKEQLINDLIKLRRRINELEKIEADKKRYEEELAQTKAMFEGLFEFAPDAIVVVNREGRIVQVNKQTERLFGYTRSELMGADHDILVPEHFRSKHLEDRRGYMAGPHVRHMGTGMELYGRKKDGSEFPADIALGPLPIKNDVVMLAVVRDFTERKKAQDELEHLASFPRLNPNPLIEVDFSGEITFCNVAAEAVLRELDTKEDCAVFLPNDIKAILDALRMNEGEQSLYYEITVKNRIFSEHIHLMPELNVVRFYIQDITERKKAEEALKQKTLQLEAANKELEAFSYSVSHDLRAPLRVIKGFSEIVLEEHPDRLNDEAKKLLNSIRLSALKMDELIRALFDLSKAGRQEMHMGGINLEELVKETFHEIMQGCPERTIRLEMKMLPPAQGDATLIRLVCVNLLSNAVKFTSHRETAAIEVGGWSDEKENVYFVKDNGVGFDPKYSVELFGTFRRLHTSQEFEGTGIGLSIVQRIIARHGGRVCAEGKPNEGAAFYFSLPRG